MVSDDISSALATADLMTSVSVDSIPAILAGFETEPVTIDAPLSSSATLGPVTEQEAIIPQIKIIEAVRKTRGAKFRNELFRTIGDPIIIDWLQNSLP